MNATSLSPTEPQVSWIKLLSFLFPQVLFVLFGTGLNLGGLWMGLPILFLMVVVPGLDWLTGWLDDVHYEKGQFSPLQLAQLHWNTRLYAVLYISATVYAVTLANGLELTELLLLGFSCSLIAGIAFAAAHELLHGKERIDQALQRVLTSFLFYPHYKLIHIRSHHVHAGTDHDENTAWMNEGIYSYLWRTIPGSFVCCWQMERRRVVPLYGSELARLWHNRMVGYALGQIALLAGMFFIGGSAGLIFYVAHLVGAHLVLESVNYIQHYGLLRRRGEGGYEKTGPEHSWDTYHYFSSRITFRVGHHSHHHIAVRPYYLLHTQPDAPKLPVGYFWAIALVLIPPWWKHNANRRLKALSAA